MINLLSIYKKIPVFLILLVIPFAWSAKVIADDEESSSATDESSSASEVEPPPPPQEDNFSDDGGGASFGGGGGPSSKNTKEVVNRFLQNPLYKENETENSAPSDALKKSKCQALKQQGVVYFSYIDKIYRFIPAQCARMEMDQDVINKMSASLPIVKEVDSDTIASLALVAYSPLDGGRISLQQPAKRTCKDFNNRYITISYVDIYWVSNCEKRLFPDSATYDNHRKNVTKNKSTVLTLSDSEMESIKEGNPFPSSLDEEYKKLLVIDRKPFEVLPLDEACKGLIGRYATYLDEIYFIQQIPKGVRGSDGTHCEKKPVDSSRFTIIHAGERLKMEELTSVKAFSIPNGSPKAL